jgi:hypothetical protein
VKAWITPGIRSFLVGGPSSLTCCGGAISSKGYMVPQLFAARGN